MLKVGKKETRKWRIRFHLHVRWSVLWRSFYTEICLSHFRMYVWHFLCRRWGWMAGVDTLVGHCVFVYVGKQTQAVRIILIFQRGMTQQTNVNPGMVRELNSWRVEDLLDYSGFHTRYAASWLVHVISLSHSCSYRFCSVCLPLPACITPLLLSSAVTNLHFLSSLLLISPLSQFSVSHEDILTM